MLSTMLHTKSRVGIVIDERASFKDLRVAIVGGRPGSVQILRTVLGMVGIVHIEAVSNQSTQSISCAANNMLPFSATKMSKLFQACHSRLLRVARRAF